MTHNAPAYKAACWSLTQHSVHTGGLELEHVPCICGCVTVTVIHKSLLCVVVVPVACKTFMK